MQKKPSRKDLFAQQTVYWNDQNKVDAVPIDPLFSVVEKCNVNPSATSIISTTLYSSTGDDQYVRGFFSDIIPWSKKHKNWQLRVYIHENAIELKNRMPADVEVFMVRDPVVDKNYSPGCMYWRFMALMEPVDVMVIDVDVTRFSLTSLHMYNMVLNAFDKYPNVKFFRLHNKSRSPVGYVVGGNFIRRKTLSCEALVDSLMNKRRSYYGCDETWLYENIVPLLSNEPVATIVRGKVPIRKPLQKRDARHRNNKFKNKIHLYFPYKDHRYVCVPPLGIVCKRIWRPQT